jgi:hypothetical protein
MKISVCLNAIHKETHLTQWHIAQIAVCYEKGMEVK